MPATPRRGGVQRRQEVATPRNLEPSELVTLLLRAAMGESLPSMRLRVTIQAMVEGERPPARPAAPASSRTDRESGAQNPHRHPRNRKRTCNHGLFERTFCSKCHIRRRHTSRWWWRQQYRQLQ